MRINDADRKQIIKTLLRKVDHISDREYQQRVWIEARGPECDDYDETVCWFFEESEAIFPRYKEFNITDDQYKLLKTFHDEFDCFNDNQATRFQPKDFLNLPEWEKIMEMAKEILEAFNYKKN